MTLRRRQILRGAGTLGVISAFPFGLTACGSEPAPVALGTIVDGGLVARAFDLRGMSWVLLPHEGRIEILDADGVLVGTVNDLAFPTAVAFDAVGRGWVVEVGAARLARIDIDRGELTRFAEGSLRCPRDVAIDGEGRVLVADLAAHRIARFDDRGRAIDLIGEPVTDTLSHEEGSLNGPRSLAIASDGTLLIVEAGELLEHFQWMTEAQSRQLDADKKQAVAHEMADVLLYLVQLSSSLGVDLMAAATEKMAINERKYPVDLAKGSSKKSDVS